MNFLVFDEIRLISKSLPTFCTHVGFFSSVSFLMCSQACLMSKVLSTLCTYIRLLSCVNSLMHIEFHPSTLSWLYILFLHDTDQQTDLIMNEDNAQGEKAFHPGPFRSEIPRTDPQFSLAVWIILAISQLREAPQCRPQEKAEE
ncbi:hypothetical protein H920_01216 [Fukomys damarensis]|uniref:Uncharacterized protein n=1 Tax=Fukomys damarensis TaxID=885580 RepID=A0A091E489_FUKDA|nr:hypothetical protein H920_01216 [Fukomys damarensis]